MQYTSAEDDALQRKDVSQLIRGTRLWQKG